MQGNEVPVDRGPAIHFHTGNEVNGGFFGTWQAHRWANRLAEGGTTFDTGRKLGNALLRYKAISAEMESGWPSADKSAAADEKQRTTLNGISFRRVTWHANGQSRSIASKSHRGDLIHYSYLNFIWKEYQTPARVRDRLFNLSFGQVSFMR